MSLEYSKVNLEKYIQGTRYK